jgi:hypothetical protein
MFCSVDKKIYCGFLESKSYTFWELWKSCQTQKKNLSPTCVQLRLGKTERKFYKENIIRCEGKANATHKKRLEWRTIKSCGKSNNKNQVHKLS